MEQRKYIKVGLKDVKVGEYIDTHTHTDRETNRQVDR
jgi:hypothetical protein